MTDLLRLDPPPVAVRVLRSVEELSDVPVYHGISYCDAVRRAGDGRVLRLLPGSIRLCQWVPPVLGLKAPENRFEAGLAPRLPYPTAGLALARWDQFPGEPQVVIVRAPRPVLERLFEEAGHARPGGKSSLLWEGHQGRLERSAVPLFTSGRLTPHHRLVIGADHALAALARSLRWRAFTYWLFRSHLATAAYDVLISHSLANMSLCRNSTIIPFLTQRVNVSFFCPGGITWGLNNPDHMTSGWPWAEFQRLIPILRGGSDG